MTTDRQLLEAQRYSEAKPASEPMTDTQLHARAYAWAREQLHLSDRDATLVAGGCVAMRAMGVTEEETKPEPRRYVLHVVTGTAAEVMAELERLAREERNPQ